MSGSDQEIARIIFCLIKDYFRKRIKLVFENISQIVIDLQNPKSQASGVH